MEKKELDYEDYIEHAAETMVVVIRLLNELSYMSESYVFNDDIVDLHYELVDKCRIANCMAKDLGLAHYPGSDMN